MLKKILLAALWLPLMALAQTYPSPTYQNVTILGSLTATGLVAPSDLATQAANTVLANVTGSAASPTAFVMPSCGTSSSALQWINGSGFACNSSINASTLGGATFAAPGAIGATTASTGAFTTLNSTGGALNGSIGQTTPAAGTFTNLAATGTLTGFVGRLAGVQLLTTSGAFSPPTGTNSELIFLFGAGGGGGGVPATTASLQGCGAGGGAGGMALSYLTSGLSGTFTFGAAGAASSGGAGGAGGSSTFVPSAGSTMTANGGAGGASSGAGGSASNGVFENTTTGGTASNGNLLNVTGNAGQGCTAAAVSNTYTFGIGGSTMLGYSVSGGAASGLGAGGNGNTIGPSATAVAGQNGAHGGALVLEFY